MVEGLGRNAEQEYWRLVHPYGITGAGDVERATRKLLEHGRAYTAVELLGLSMSRNDALPPALVAETLEAALRTPLNEDAPGHLFSHYFPDLLDALEECREIDEARIAALEWAFLPILTRNERTPKILHRELARSPDFFMTVLKMVFRAEGEEPRELSEEERARARHGHDLLDSWRTLPGTTDAGVDVDTLREWVRQARATAVANGRGPIADQVIGQVLSSSPVGPDGVWPHEAVRDVIEEVESAELERGFRVGLHNSRGVVTKAVGEAGAQERQLATVALP